MNLVSIRLITDDVRRLVDFYEQATGVDRRLVDPGLRRDRHTGGHAGDRAHPHGRAVRRRERPPGRQPHRDHRVPRRRRGRRVRPAAGAVDDFVNEPTTMPWGNRSLLFRDPDGNLVNFFTPVTPEAVAKFRR